MWKEEEHPRNEDGTFREKEKASKLLGVKLSPINIKKTGMSYYDQLIPGDSENEYMRKYKNLKGEIIEMSPNEYYEKCAKDIFKNTSVESLKEQRRVGQNSSFLSGVIDKGEQLNMPMLDYVNKGQEGLHRMMVLGDKFGWDKKFPVLVVDYADLNYEKQLRSKRIDRALENIKEDVEEERIYDKESFIKELNKKLRYDYKIIDEGSKYIISDDLIKKEFEFPKSILEDDDLLEEDDLLDYDN